MEPYYDDHQVRSHYPPSIEDFRATFKKPIESDVANSFHVVEPWDENRYACGWFSPCINVKSGRVPYVSSDHDISDNVWSSNSRSQSSHASATWYFDDEYLASWPTSAALFVGACVAAVPMAQYRPEHQYNNGEPFSHDARSYSHAPCKATNAEHHRWPSLERHMDIKPSADVFSISTLGFCAACGLLCRNNRRSTSQKPLLFIAVSAALAWTSYHGWEDRIPWNMTVPVAVITALLLSRILDGIYRWIGNPLTNVDE